jgi:hypothetical protein
MDHLPKIPADTTLMIDLGGVLWETSYGWVGCFLGPMAKAIDKKLCIEVILVQQLKVR